MARHNVAIKWLFLATTLAAIVCRAMLRKHGSISRCAARKLAPSTLSAYQRRETAAFGASAPQTPSCRGREGGWVNRATDDLRRDGGWDDVGDRSNGVIS